MSKVADNIQEQKLTLQNQGIDTYYEENQGNHFADVTERMVKVMSAQNKCYPPAPSHTLSQLHRTKK